MSSGDIIMLCHIFFVINVGIIIKVWGFYLIYFMSVDVIDRILLMCAYNFFHIHLLFGTYVYLIHLLTLIAVSRISIWGS
ncbi:uncharacterized protein DS421_4g112310 [Arachis hypogaea]|nr:uncharacterized protein DS421_4g112310 [Arachis hypogaea]